MYNQHILNSPQQSLKWMNTDTTDSQRKFE